MCIENLQNDLGVIMVLHIQQDDHFNFIVSAYFEREEHEYGRRQQ